jgi:hypothetical protein
MVGLGAELIRFLREGCHRDAEHYGEQEGFPHTASSC